MPSYRKIYFALSILCAALLLTALYLEYVDGIEPCMLCMLQRVLLVMIGIVSLFASLRKYGNVAKNIYNLLIITLSSFGLLSAIRQIWLQHQPISNRGFCVPGYHFLLETAAWKSLLKYLLIGTPECSRVTWVWLGLSLAEWSAIFFLVLLVMAFLQIFNKNLAP